MKIINKDMAIEIFLEKSKEYNREPNLASGDLQIEENPSYFLVKFVSIDAKRNKYIDYGNNPLFIDKISGKTHFLGFWELMELRGAIKKKVLFEKGKSVPIFLKIIKKINIALKKILYAFK